MNNQISSQSSFSNNCCYCDSYRQFQSFPLLIQTLLYHKQTKFHNKNRKIINKIIYGQPGKIRLDFKQSIYRMQDEQIKGMRYKNFKQIIHQIKPCITLNINPHQHYDKLYFGIDNSKVMLKYKQQKNKVFTNHKLTPHYPKFTINKSALSTDSSNNKLLTSQIHKKYNFYPVQEIQASKSKFQSSIVVIQKLMRRLSVMIGQIKIEQSQFPQTKNIFKPYVDFHKSKQQLKFRKKLQQNFSEIHQEKIKYKAKQNVRLYTSPDPGNDSFNGKKYAQAYGLLFQNPQVNKKKNKKSFTKRQFSKQKTISTNASKTKLMSTSRQITQQSSYIIIKNKSSNDLLNIPKSKSKSKIKINSNNRLLLATSSSRNKIVRNEKSLNKSKKLIGIRK